MTAHVFGRVYDDLPHGVWSAPGLLTLLDGLTVALPWGSLAAAAPLEDGRSELYSMNHHAGPLTPPLEDPPPWARPCLDALDGTAAGLRLVVNRLLPAEVGLTSGAETAVAVSLALRDLHGRDLPHPGPEPFPCDLAARGLRLLLAEVGTPAPDGPPPCVPAAAEVLRTGDLAAFGSLLSRAHRPGTQAVDLALDAALRAGALGGRGIGRCAVALVPLARVHEIRSAVTARLKGVTRRPPRILTAVPAPAARRVA